MFILYMYINAVVIQVSICTVSKLSFISSSMCNLEGIVLLYWYGNRYLVFCVYIHEILSLVRQRSNMSIIKSSQHFCFVHFFPFTLF